MQSGKDSSCGIPVNTSSQGSIQRHDPKMVMLINQNFWCQNRKEDNKFNISVACDATFNHCSHLQVTTEAISQGTRSICA